MCDYSISATRTRAAEKDDRLVSFKFPLGSTGFIPENEEISGTTAVCILPGTELAFDAPIRVAPNIYMAVVELKHTVAIFRQTDKDNPRTHHDILEFPNGTTVFLAHLAAGQRAKVLQLPAAPKTKAEAQEQERAVFVG